MAAARPVKGKRQGFFKRIKSRIEAAASIFYLKKKGLPAGKVLLLLLASIGILILVGGGSLYLFVGFALGDQAVLAAISLIAGIGLSIFLIIKLWVRAARKANPGKEQRQEQLRQEQLQLEAQHSAELPFENQIKVSEPSVRVCIEESGDADEDRVTLTFDGKILAENVKIGTNPRCFDLELQKGAPNILTLQNTDGGSVPLDLAKITIEESSRKQIRTVKTAAGQATTVQLNY